MSVRINPEFLTLDPDLLSMPAPALASIHELTIEIGEMPILVRTDSRAFARMLEDRYGQFIRADAPRPVVELEIDLVKDPGLETPDSGFGKGGISGLSAQEGGVETSGEDLSVRRDAGRWVMERGGFRAKWDPESRQCRVRQSANPYAIDGVLRILHSLLLARAGGFLVHATSAVCTGRAFVFAGVSGVGKTTLARLAPPNVTLLTDEVSYVKQVSGTRCQVPGASSQGSGIRDQGSGNSVGAPRRQGLVSNASFQMSGNSAPADWPLTPAFEVFGTPFAGELARLGQKVRAPLATLFLLKQGPENRIEPVSQSQAVRELLRHVLFFARDEELVRMIFETACGLVARVPVRRLVFAPDPRVWELIA